MNSEISNQHLSKTAYVYVRQSTLAQVRHNQESTERQYALREKALELGWSEPTIRILDGDLGKSGAQIAGREDFKTLVAEVSMGKWAQSLRWRYRGWRVRIWTGIDCWNCVHLPVRW
jgi:hypothetical protein